MAQYSIQYSFSTIGAEGVQTLRSLRDRLAALEGRPLTSVYKEFGVVAIHPVEVSDILVKVDVVRTSTAEGRPYAFFVLATRTTGAPYSDLWAGIGQSAATHVRVDMLGSGSDGEKFCKPVFLPEDLVFDFERGLC